MISANLYEWREMTDDEKLLFCNALVAEYDRHEKLIMTTNVEMFHVRDHPEHALINQASGIFHDWRRIRWNIVEYAKQKNWPLALNAIGYMYGISAFLEYLSVFYKFTLPEGTDLDAPWAKCVADMQKGLS